MYTGTAGRPNMARPSVVRAPVALRPDGARITIIGMPDLPEQPMPPAEEPLPVDLSDQVGESPAPLPVEALPIEPLPVQAMDIGGSGWPAPRLGPPGIVVAMGVCSIVIASVGLLGGVVTTMSVAVVSATLSARTVGTAGVVAPRAMNPPPVEVLDPNGMPAADRWAAIQGLSRARPITPGQQLQLDELLAESGRDVIGTGSPVDPAVVAAGVSASGQLGTLGTAGGADPSPSYFTLAGGRLELTDGRAVFFPGDGQPSLHAVAYALPELPEGAAPPVLSDEAIRSTLRAVARLNLARPKAAQVRAILSLLRGAGQQVVVPTTDGSDPAAEVTAAETQPDGTLTVETTHGGSTCELTVTPAGQVAASLTPVPSAAAATSPTNSLALGAVVITSAVQLAVAVYLLVIGILTVRRSRAGRLLHWIYVAVKLPVGVAAVAAAVWFWRSLPTAGGDTPWVAVPAAVGLLYPVVLIFVLCGRSARDYYGTSGVTSDGRRSAPW